MILFMPDNAPPDEAGRMTWQLSAEPMRTYVRDDRGGRFRPTMCVVVDGRSGFCFGMDVGKEDEPPHDLAGRVLSKSIRAAGAPAQVQVRDAELATALRRREELQAVAFEIVDRLEAVDMMLTEMEGDLFAPPVPPLLDQLGMSLDRLRAFVDACALFYRARPWRELLDEDVIEVESPAPPPGMRCASILGAAGEVMGIGFFANLKDYDKLVERAGSPRQAMKPPRWSLMFYAPDELPTEDLDVWQEHGLRVAVADDEGDAIPLLLRMGSGGGIDRPDGKRLTFVEGLCRAIAASTEAEIDSGRWLKEVETFAGPRKYWLAIPHLLEARSPAKSGSKRAAGMAGPPGPAGMEQSMQQIMRMLQQSGAGTIEEMNAFLVASLKDGVIPDPPEPTTNEERALDLCYQAQSSRARRALQLIREALRLDANCAQAYVMLAQRQSDPAAAEPIYRQAVAAGRRALGDEPFREPGYPFWGVIESRPFMRAMAGLAECLEAQDRGADAADVIAEMLRLNPGDNQGMRYRYVPLLIEQDRLDEARSVIESRDYQDDICALWEFSAALIAFRQSRAADAEAALNRGMKRNRFVVPFLLQRDQIPPYMPEAWSPGDEAEAMMVVDLLGDAWNADPAAAKWLAQSVRPSPRGAAKKSGKARGKGKGKRKS